MQVRIISFKRSSHLLKECRRMFPGADVRMQPAVDVRSETATALYNAELLSLAAAHSLDKGRRWHHEMSSTGAVGLAHANRLALEEDPTQPLLLLEEDCMFTSSKNTSQAVTSLLEHVEDFDVAVFGAIPQDSSRGPTLPWLPAGFEVLDGQFWLLHCVLYTPRGRKRVAKVLNAPLEMQIDSMMGTLARLGRLTILGQTSRWSAIQMPHTSTVQTFHGLSSHWKSRTHYYGTVGIVILAVALGWCFAAQSRKVFRTCHSGTCSPISQGEPVGPGP